MKRAVLSLLALCSIPLAAQAPRKTQSIPEPATLFIVGSSLCAIALVGRRSRNRK